MENRLPDLSKKRINGHPTCWSSVRTGAKDRYVPLPERSLGLLREYWKTHRNPVLLFPAQGRDHIDLRISSEPMSKSSVQKAFRAALKASGNNKLASVHTLRHSWATHLLEAGVNLRLIQEAWPQLACDDQRLYASDRESRRPRRRGHQPDHERPLIPVY